MSNIRTLIHLNECLSTDLSWRKKELSILKGLIETKSFDKSKRNALIRSGITLLYAHWEGYIKCAASAYLEFVSNVARQGNLKYHDLTYNFIAIAMKSELNKASSTNQASIHNEVVKFLIEDIDKRANIPTQDVIKTDSNLSSKVLYQMLTLLGIDHKPYEIEQVLIDKKLLEKRNMIAHGEYLDTDTESYQKMHEKIIYMMNLFKDQVENNAAQKLYLQSIKSISD